MMAAAKMPTLVPVDMCMVGSAGGEEGEVVEVGVGVDVGVVVGMVWVARVDDGVVCGFYVSVVSA